MRDKDIESLVRTNIRTLSPYSTARDEYQGGIGVFLDANESPYDTGYNRYPDPRQKVLKERISTIKGVPIENIFLGNGSDEAIDLVYRIFCEPGVDNAVIMAPSYGMYSVAADINGVERRGVMLEADFSLPMDRLLAASDSHTKIMFICSPNNPSGNAFPLEQLLDLADRFDGMLVVDEAYTDFSTKGSLIGSIKEHPNLILLQTMSKAYGLAGLRLGMAFAQPYVIRLMSMVKYPYNISQATQEEALKAIASPVDVHVKEILEQRCLMEKMLPSFKCVKKVWPSDANFLLVEVDDADRMYAHLVSDGIIVRNRSRVQGCSGCIRITIGLKEENEKLVESIERYEKGDIRG